MMLVCYRKAPPLLSFGWSTLALDMADLEIGMDPREGTSHSPPGQRDIFASETHGGSPIALVLTSPTPVEARGYAVPLASAIPLVPEEAMDIGPPVPIVPSPEISGEQGMREALQLLTRMVSIHERELESGVDIQRDRSESLKVREFLHLAHLLFTGSSLNEDPQDFIGHIYRVLRVMHASIKEAVELASFRLRDVAILWNDAWERCRGPDALPAEWEDFSEAFLSHYFPLDVREARLDQFINLKQGTMSVRDYSHKLNSLTTEDLSKRIRDTCIDREQSKSACTMGSYREPHGDFTPPFHRYPPRPVGSASPQV
ncbi:hypothetical protein MTR67_001687 [Solanum verrucosum]|uniref:Retrotransposon gag domain-containing protein n=1 Tax=Solanum verrucosum TaxID=315347 RepID=A0AAF0T585_SOLVR|nr:hypothetical protein MTR67_001687 [Solanum verrucosum]